MKYVPPALRKQQETQQKEEEKQNEVVKITEQLKEKEEELKKHEQALEGEAGAIGDDFEVVLNSVVISQILKNKDFRGELLGFYVKEETEGKKKKKKKKGKGGDEEKKEKKGKEKGKEEMGEDKDGQEEDGDEDGEAEMGEEGENEFNAQHSNTLNELKKTEKKKMETIEINQSFSVINVEDIFVHKINKIMDMYQLPQQKLGELLNNLNLYFNKNKYEEEGDKYIADVNNYYEEYINILSELNFETSFFGFYININDIHRKDVLATLMIYSLLNKNSFVLCYSEQYGKLVFSAYKIDVDVVFETKNQVKNLTFSQFNDILNIEIKKEGLNSRNILQTVPVRIQNSIINSLFLKLLKSKNRNYIAPDDYLNFNENDALQQYVYGARKSLEHLAAEQEKMAKYKKDVFKQLQTQKAYMEKKQLEREKNKLTDDNMEINEEDLAMQNAFKSVPQPSLLYPFVLTMSNNMKNDSINNLCSHSIAKSYLHYKNTKS